jgi:hypothetical protein
MCFLNASIPPEPSKATFTPVSTTGRTSSPRSPWRASALGAIAITAAAAYLLDLLGIMWTPAETVARISPFHYFHGAAILAGTANTALDLSVLGTITIASIALAYWKFDRRDL